jgi:hypothetical protein
MSGLPLYYASAVFVRHTLNALYTNLSVELKRITVNSSVSGSGSARSSSTGGDGERDSEDAKNKPSARHRREKSVFIAVTVTGKSRVSGSLGVWDVYVPRPFPFELKKTNPSHTRISSLVIGFCIFSAHQRTSFRQQQRLSRITPSTLSTLHHMRLFMRHSVGSYLGVSRCHLKVVSELDLDAQLM